MKDAVSSSAYTAASSAEPSTPASAARSAGAGSPRRTAPAAARRRYDDGCAAAHALDLVGERWALLIVRELLLGPRRFSELRQALGSISPNVLTQRLIDLEAAGVLARRDLPPPAACRVYGLTTWGAELEAAILELLKWGVRSPAFERGRPLTADAMALSFKAMFQPAAAAGLSCRITFIMHRNTYHAAIERGRLAVVRGDPPCHPAQSDSWAQATLHADPVVVLRLAYGKQPLTEALREGDCRLDGDEAALTRYFSCFEVAPAIDQTPQTPRPSA